MKDLNLKKVSFHLISWSTILILVWAIFSEVAFKQKKKIEYQKHKTQIPQNPCFDPLEID